MPLHEIDGKININPHPKIWNSVKINFCISLILNGIPNKKIRQIIF
jgi:hypothetical protein